MASKQLLLTSFVKPTSKEDSQLRAEGATKKHEVYVKPKNRVGRPRKQNPPMTTALVATSTPVLKHTLRRPRGSRGSYMNWFTDDSWPQIATAVKKYRNLSTPQHFII